KKHKMHKKDRNPSCAFCASCVPFLLLKSFASVVSLMAEESRMETNTSVGQDARAICAECGKGFSVNDMIRYGAAYVCATCKPLFMQKLAEGARISSVGMRYAGFWLRFGAVLLDGIILFIMTLILQLAFGFSTQAINGGPRSALLIIVQQFLGLIIGVLY